MCSVRTRVRVQTLKKKVIYFINNSEMLELGLSFTCTKSAFKIFHRDLSGMFSYWGISSILRWDYLNTFISIRQGSHYNMLIPGAMCCNGVKLQISREVIQKLERVFTSSSLTKFSSVPFHNYITNLEVKMNVNKKNCHRWKQWLQVRITF